MANAAGLCRHACKELIKPLGSVFPVGPDLPPLNGTTSRAIIWWCQNQRRAFHATRKERTGRADHSQAASVEVEVGRGKNLHRLIPLRPRHLTKSPKRNSRAQLVHTFPFCALSCGHQGIRLPFCSHLDTLLFLCCRLPESQRYLMQHLTRQARIHVNFYAAFFPMPAQKLT